MVLSLVLSARDFFNLGASIMYEVYQQNQYKRWELNNSELERLYKDVAAQMGQWQLVYDNGYSLTFDKYELRLNVESYPNNSQRANPRIEIRIYGNIAEAKKSIWFILSSKQIEPYTTKITVAISRGALAIAKEINRRLIPDYMTLYSKAYEAWKQSEDAANHLKQLTWQIASVIDSLPHANYNGHEIYEYLDVGLEHSLRVEVRVSKISHDVKLGNVPTEILTEILQIINSHSKQSVYERWLQKTQKTMLYKLNKHLGIYDSDNELTQLPPNSFNWRNAYLTNLHDLDIWQQFSKVIEQQLIAV